MAVYDVNNSNNKYTLRLTLTERSLTDDNILSNKSIIDYTLQLIANTSTHFSQYTIGHSISLNNQIVSSESRSTKYSIAAYGTLTLASGYAEISHETDGTKVMPISFSIDMDNTSYTPGSLSKSDSMTLTTIPRASAITGTDANIGSASTIVINRAVNSFTHTITYSFKDLSGTIATKTTETTIPWTIPTSFFQQIPNASSGIVTLTCTTYSGDTVIGTKTTNMIVTVPTSGTNDSTPVITSATAIDTNSATTALTGNNKRLVLYKSTVQLSAEGQCKNYAGFKYFRENNIYDLTSTTNVSGGTTTVNGQRVYSASTTPTFDKTQFRVTLIDTRNTPSDTKILNQANGDFTIIPYVPLTINANIDRVSPTSNSIKMNFSGNFYNGYYDENNTNFNDLTIKWRYKKVGVGENWITTGADDTTNGWHNLTLGTDYQYNQNQNIFSSINDIIIADLFNYQEAYIVEIYYADRLSEESWSNERNPILKGEPIHDEGVDRDGNNYFNVNGDIYCNNEKISKKELITDQECATNEYIDGKRVFIKIIEFDDTIGGGLQNRLVKVHNISGATRVWVDLSNSYIKPKTADATYPLPIVYYAGNIDALGIIVDNTYIYMEAQSGWNNNWLKHIALKYVK